MGGKGGKTSERQSDTGVRGSAEEQWRSVGGRQLENGGCARERMDGVNAEKKQEQKGSRSRPQRDSSTAYFVFIDLSACVFTRPCVPRACACLSRSAGISAPACMSRISRNGMSRKEAAARSEGRRVLGVECSRAVSAYYVCDT